MSATTGHGFASAYTLASRPCFAVMLKHNLRVFLSFKTGESTMNRTWVFCAIAATILTVVAMGVWAADKPPNSYAPVVIPRSSPRRSPGWRRKSRRSNERQAPAAGAVRPERPAGQGRDHVARQGGAGGSAGEAARGRRSWQELAAMTPEEIREKGALAEGLPAPAASQPRRGRDALSASTTSTRSSSRKAAT